MDVKQMTTLPKGLEVGEIGIIDEMLSITVVSTQPCPACPLCGTPSTRVHSHYTRCVADLPCGGRTVRLLLHNVRKCFCQVPTCERQIFVERLNPFIEPWARVTQRLFQVVQAIGLATGGRLGVRLTNQMADHNLSAHDSPTHHGSSNCSNWGGDRTGHRRFLCDTKLHE